MHVGAVCDILCVTGRNFFTTLKHLFVVRDAIDRGAGGDTDYIGTRNMAIANKASLGTVEFHRLVVRKKLYTTTIWKVVRTTLDGKGIDY